MRYLVASSWSREFAELAAITWPDKIRYAERHGYAVAHRVFRPATGAEDQRLRWWHRTAYWATLLDGMLDGDVGLFVGCDVCVTRKDRTLAEFIDPGIDLAIQIDGALVFGDALLVRAGPLTRALFRDLRKAAADEQIALSEALRGEWFLPVTHPQMNAAPFWAAIEPEFSRTGLAVRVINGRRFAGDDPKHWPNGVPSGHGVLPAEACWSGEHLLLHLGGLNMEKRIRAATEACQ